MYSSGNRSYSGGGQSKGSNNGFQKKFKKSPEDLEKDMIIEKAKRRYGMIVAGLIAGGSSELELAAQLKEGNETAREAMDTLKSLYNTLKDERPNAIQYLNRPYFLGLKLIGKKGAGFAAKSTAQISYNDDIDSVVESTVVRTEEDLNRMLAWIFHKITNDELKEENEQDPQFMALFTKLTKPPAQS